MGKLGLSLLILLAIVACRREDVKVLDIPYYKATESIKKNVKLDSEDSFVVPFEHKDYQDLDTYVLGAFTLGGRFININVFSMINREVQITEPKYMFGHFEHNGYKYDNAMQSIVYIKTFEHDNYLKITKYEKREYKYSTEYIELYSSYYDRFNNK